MTSSRLHLVLSLVMGLPTISCHSDLWFDEDASIQSIQETELETGLETGQEILQETDSGCYEGSYLIETQASCEELSLYSCVTGDLTILSDGLKQCDLPHLREVQGNLVIGKAVASSYMLQKYNADEISIAPRDFRDNDLLENLDGLSQLTSVGGHVIICGTAKLADISGLSSLTQINGSLGVILNHSLGSLEGLHNITDVQETVYVEDNDSLKDLTGLRGLQYVAGFLQLTYNPVLSSQNLEELQNIEHIGQALVLKELPNLQNVKGLEKLTFITHVVVKSLPALTSLKGIDNLEHILGSLHIFGNPNLESLDGLQSLRKVDSTFKIEGNPKLSTLTGLTVLQGVGPWDSTFEGGYLNIIDNNSLTDISALYDMNFVRREILALRNTSLPQCAICDLVQSLQFGFYGELKSAQNASDSCSDDCQ